MSERHIMIDLETLSTRADAALASIGAYCFEPASDDRTFDSGRAFYTPVRMADSIASGAHVDGGTLGWWLLQSEQARSAIAAQETAPPLIVALGRFYDWAITGGFDPQDIVIWSHAGFDFPILQLAYARSGVEPPFWYRSPRDMRTIIHAAYGRNLDVEDEEPDFPANLNQHHAMYDAWQQAVAVQYCFRRLAAPVQEQRGEQEP